MAILQKEGKQSQEKLTTNQRRLLIKNDNFAVQEAYKTLRTNVRFCLQGTGCKRICITSAMSGEGKSITFLNLAISIAEAGQKVLLIDADLRRPAVARLTGKMATPGLSNVLAGLVKAEEAIRKEIYPNMDVIFSGDIPPNPSELLGTEAFRSLIETLSEQYEYILIDAPPVNVVSDACIIANCVDGVLVLVRQGRSRKDAVKQAVNNLQLTGAKVLGFVLNGVKLDTGKKYGYYT